MNSERQKLQASVNHDGEHLASLLSPTSSRFLARPPTCPPEFQSRARTHTQTHTYTTQLLREVHYFQLGEKSKSESVPTNLGWTWIAPLGGGDLGKNQTSIHQWPTKRASDGRRHRDHRSTVSLVNKADAAR